MDVPTRIGKIVVIPNSMIPSEKKKSRNRKQTAATEKSNDLSNFDFSKGLDPNTPKLPLPTAIDKRLFPHQRYGVQWMYSLHLKNCGGILGDDMGLGKTFQVTSFLTGAVMKSLAQKILILAPVSVLQNWERELNQFLKPEIPNVSIVLMTSEMTKKKRQKLLFEIFYVVSASKPVIVVSSYQLVANMIQDFTTINGRTNKWDYVILDEGHLIKNHTTKLSKAMCMFRCSHRLVLTGTPIQNNLNEFWTIANWVTNGKVFGSLNEFRERFSAPILAGQDPHASEEAREYAQQATKLLMSMIQSFLLQRKKCEQAPSLLKLPEKKELVVWIPLATAQRTAYETYLHSRKFNNAMDRTAYPVEAVNYLKTLCRHPFLLEAAEMNKKRRDKKQQSTGTALSRSNSIKSASKNARKTSIRGDEDEEEGNNEGDENLDWLNQSLDNLNLHDDSEQANEDGGAPEDDLDCNLPNNANVFDVAGRDADLNELLRGSIKLRVLTKLVYRLHQEGHRTLIFSQSRLMVDIIQRVLAEYRLSSCRIDGSVSGKDRQKIIDDFNRSTETDGDDDENDGGGYTGPTICLLTTKACGTGVTLTGADRVIIFDPSWNPAEDRQAVDRAFRIGQKRNVVVFRFIMASSIEEKMYEKQVFKDGLRVVTESGNSSRYFSNNETKDLFTLGPAEKSLVMERLWEKNNNSLKSVDDTYGEVPGILGFSRHDQLYAEVRPDEYNQTQQSQMVSEAVADEEEGEESQQHGESAVFRIEPPQKGPAPTQQVAKGSNHSAAVIDLTLDEEDSSVPSFIIKTSTRVTTATATITTGGKTTSHINSIVLDSDEEEEFEDEPAAVRIKTAAELAPTTGFTRLKKNRAMVISDDEEEEWTDEPSATSHITATEPSLILHRTAEEENIHGHTIAEEGGLDDIQFPEDFSTVKPAKGRRSSMRRLSLELQSSEELLEYIFEGHDGDDGADAEEGDPAAQHDPDATVIEEFVAPPHLHVAADDVPVQAKKSNEVLSYIFEGLDDGVDDEPAAPPADQADGGEAVEMIELSAVTEDGDDDDEPSSVKERDDVPVSRADTVTGRRLSKELHSAPKYEGIEYAIEDDASDAVNDSKQYVEECESEGWIVKPHAADLNQKIVTAVPLVSAKSVEVDSAYVTDSQILHQLHARGDSEQRDEDAGYGASILDASAVLIGGNAHHSAVNDSCSTIAFNNHSAMLNATLLAEYLADSQEEEQQLQHYGRHSGEDEGEVSYCHGEDVTMCTDDSAFNLTRDELFPLIEMRERGEISDSRLSRSSTATSVNSGNFVGVEGSAHEPPTFAALPAEMLAIEENDADAAASQHQLQNLTAFAMPDLFASPTAGYVAEKKKDIEETIRSQSPLPAKSAIFSQTPFPACSQVDYSSVRIAVFSTAKKKRVSFGCEETSSDEEEEEEDSDDNDDDQEEKQPVNGGDTQQQQQDSYPDSPVHVITAACAHQQLDDDGDAVVEDATRNAAESESLYDDSITMLDNTIYLPAYNNEEEKSESKLYLTQYSSCSSGRSVDEEEEDVVYSGDGHSLARLEELDETTALDVTEELDTTAVGGESGVIQEASAADLSVTCLDSAILLCDPEETVLEDSHHVVERSVYEENLEETRFDIIHQPSVEQPVIPRVHHYIESQHENVTNTHALSSSPVKFTTPLPQLSSHAMRDAKKVVNKRLSFSTALVDVQPAGVSDCGADGTQYVVEERNVTGRKKRRDKNAKNFVVVEEAIEAGFFDSVMQDSIVIVPADVVNSPLTADEAASPKVAAAMVAGGGVICHHPWQTVTSQQRHQYNALLKQGKKYEDAEELEDAGRCYMKALKICDEDVALQRKLAWLMAAIM